jgi:hypothetical protein
VCKPEPKENEREEVLRVYVGAGGDSGVTKALIFRESGEARGILKLTEISSLTFFSRILSRVTVTYQEKYPIGYNSRKPQSARLRRRPEREDAGANAQEQEEIMKKAVLVSSIGMMALTTGLAGLAQMPNQHVFTMKSSFYAGDAKMPAGTYTLSPVQEEHDIYELRNSSGTHSVIVETRASSKTAKGNGKGNGEVLFNRYGTTDYLEGVETSNGSSIDIIPGVAEKMAAKKSAAQAHTVPAD